MVIKIRTGNQFKKYIGKGDIDFPEIYFHQDEVLSVVKLFLIAGRTKTITINTRDAMLVEAFEVLTDDGDGQVEFFVDDIYEGKTLKREILPNELYRLYNTMGRAYSDKIDLMRLWRERYENDDCPCDNCH